MKKILCIDDRPDDEFGERTLEQHLTAMFKGRYKVFFEKDPDRGVEIVRRDKSVRLVFLDIDFYGEPRGPEIADALRSVDPGLKIIVLTTIDRQGEKVRLGKRPNVKKYVIKKCLPDSQIRENVANLAEALIEDPHNKNWRISVDYDNSAITLRNTEKRFEKTFNVPSKNKQDILDFIESCIENPNACISLKDIFGNLSERVPLNEIVYELNKRVWEETGWRTWGLLDSLICGKNAAKLVIGVDNAETTFHSDEYNELQEEIKELKRRLLALEKIFKKHQ